MKDYYSVLGISPGSKIEEIKKAYRKKAKEFHPDKNKSADAQEKFIAITEAYEVLVNGKPVKTNALPFQSSYNKYKNVYSAPSDPKEYNEWLNAIRERAWRESGLSYEEYKKIKKARAEKQKRNELYHILIVIGVFVFVATLIITGQWMIFALIFTGIAFAFAYYLIKDIITLLNIKISPGELKIIRKAFPQILSILGVIFTYFSIVFVGYRTLVSVPNLLLAFFLISCLSFFPTARFLNEKFHISKWSVVFINLLITAPVLFGTLLWINFLINYSTKIETHKIVDFKEIKVNWTTEDRTYYSKLILEKNVYSEFPRIWTFESFQLEGAPEYIECKFGEGILGFRVLKSYHFINTTN